MNHEVPFSPVALVGTIALFGAYLVAAWCVAAGIAGNARKNRKLVNSSVYGLYGFVALVVLASAMMIYAFVTHDFSIKYVASVSDTTMPVWYKITAFWGGLDGSLLFWVLVLSLFSCVAIAMNHKRHREMIGYVVATIMVVQVFFLSLLIFTKNPFSTFLTQPPTEGQGLNPLLQNYWMVIHPPSLYTGFVASTIPFAFGIGALASGRLDDLWLGSVRVWMLICFFFLSFGLILGGRWAYEELGWGGYWAWDPVENAGLIPWFTATAFLHSAIIQEQKGMMKGWNLVLVTLTFFFTIFGTFMTRSGVVQSVHAFGEDNVLALQFVAFMALILVVSLGLIVYRSNKLSKATQFESFYSREFAFLLNNWILLGCAVFVLFATMFPTIYEAFAGTRASVGPEFFNKWMTPLALTLLALAGGAPLLAWRQTTRERVKNQMLFPVALAAVTIVVLLIFFPSTTHTSALFADSIELPVSLVCFATVAFVVGSIGQEFVRGVIVRRKQTGSDPFTSMIGLVVSKRRKYGGYIVHLGVALMFIGFAGKAYDRMIDRTIDKPALTDGRTSKNPDGWWRENMDSDGTLKRIPKDTRSAFPFGGYVFVYENLIHTSDDHKDAVTAQVSIWKDGSEVGVVYPAKWDYHKQESQQTTEVAITVRFSEDVYLVLTGYDMESQQANFRVFINPLISWVWIGFMVLAAGVFVCLLPQRLLEWMFSSRFKVGNLAVLALVLGMAGAARADGTEHVQAGMGMGQAGGGYAAMNRPKDELDKRVMEELLCPCNCARRTIFECDCATAAKLRGSIMETLAGMDRSTDAKREAAYNALLDQFVKEYGGEQVLATPKSKSAWLLPVLAIGGGLGLLVVVGRSWMKPKAPPPPPPTEADEAYADKLDDELAETD